MACTPQQIKHTRQNWQAQNFTPMDRARIHFSYYVNFGACQSWRPCSIHILTTPFFLAQSAPSAKKDENFLPTHSFVPFHCHDSPLARSEPFSHAIYADGALLFLHGVRTTAVLIFFCANFLRFWCPTALICAAVRIRAAVVWFQALLCTRLTAYM
jgi:hypothetical protein